MVCLLLTMLLLFGCYGNHNTGKESSASTSPPASNAKASPSAPATEAASVTASTTRSYQDAMGRTVEIPTHPQRIIAHYFASEAVSLGLPLVGTNFINAAEVLTEAQLQGVEDIGGVGGALNLEKVVSLSPELIIVPNFMETKDIDNLSKIAPTVAIDYGADVFTRLRAIGDIAGKADRAEEWIASYHEKAAEKREQLKSVVRPRETAAAFILYQDKQLYLYSPAWIGQTMHNALGLAIPPKVQRLFDSKPDSLWEPISLEVLPEYAADYIFLLVSNDSEDARKMAEEIIKGPIWKNLPAVKNGKAFVVDSKWGFTDPMTLDWLLDEMTNTILNK